MPFLWEKKWMLLILGVLCICVSFNLVNGQLQCPIENQVTAFPNGTITFGPLSEGSGPVDASYDPGAIGGWNALANGFAGSVQSSSLPYDLILSVVNSTFISTQPSQNFDPLGFLQNFAAWWAGILVVTLLGIFFGVLFLIVGSCFWCCRCCGNCGGAKSQRARERNDCMTFTFAAILLLCTLILLAAAVLAFFSNEQTFRSVDNIQTTLNSVVNNSAAYLRDTTREVNDLICQFSDSQEGVLQAVVREIDGIRQQFTTTLNEISAQLTALISLNSTAIISDVSTQLSAFNSSVSAVNTTLSSITTDLTTVRDDLNRAVSECNSITGADCSSIIQARDAITNALSQIPVVPDVSDQIGDIAAALSGIGGTIIGGQNALMDAIGPQITQEIDAAIDQVTPIVTQANNSFVALSDGLNAIIQPLATVSFNETCPPLDGFAAFSSVDLPQVNFAEVLGPSGGSPPTQPPVPTGRFQLTLGYINDCIINASFDYIKQFDVYRYAIGIIICCLALVTIVLIWAGLLFGLLGFRKDRYPHDRSKVSHCGGIFLLISVGLTFLFGFFLLLLSSIFFFLGSNSLELCQSLQGPNYELFANTIDQPQVKLAITRDSRSSNAIPSISGLLRDCEMNNAPLYTAANLNKILNATVPTWAGSIEATIMQLFNLTSLRQTIDTSIRDAANRFNLSQSDINEAIEMTLRSIPNDTLLINVTETILEAQAAVDTANLNDSIMALQNLSRDLSDIGQTGLARNIDSIVATLQNIRDTSLVTLFMQLNELDTTVSALNSAADDLRQNVNEIANEISAVVANISGPVLNRFINDIIGGAVNRSFSFLSQYIINLDDQIVNTVGGCQPIFGVYTQLHNTVCRNFLDGLNGFWWSLGFCSLLFVPVIIFAVITSSFFLRKKSTEEEDDAYLAYPMKSY